MAYLLDTTALSEFTKPRPNGGFLAWMSAHTAEETCIGAPSLGELEIGIALLDQSEKRRKLERWLARLVADFADRILPFDAYAARLWGKAVGNARKNGKTVPAIDTQIAAIACARKLIVVTRNVRHFARAGFDGLEVVNPWSAS